MPENLLIVRTDRIGDVVLSLPLAGIVKKHLPDCRITFLLREYTKQLGESHPFIDDIIILKEEDGKIPLWKNVEKIKKRNFDACIVVYPTFITALIIFLSRIKIRVGTGYRWYSSLFNRKVYVHRKYGEKHELEFNVELLQEIGIEETVSKTSVSFNLKPGDKEKQEIRKIFEETGISGNKPVIIVHPGSGGSAVDLPLIKFKELIELLTSRTDAQVILTGSKNETDLCSELVISEKVKNFAGRLNLSQLIALIDAADIFVANSTGPIHIAAALGKYTIGFYPHILACSSRRWGPYSEKSYVFSPENDCADCRREQCEHTNCMNTIKVTDIFVRIEKICKLIVNNGEFNG
ncbi:MAG: glycosyltransferase family 9 protein [Ignavibacteriaceae bacterium]